MNASIAVAPAHVPADLVFDVDIGLLSEERYMTDPLSIWRDLRGMPPLFWSNRRLDGVDVAGAWVTGDADVIRTIMQDGVHFSANRALVNDADANPMMSQLVPLFSDPPEHGKYRALLAPIFSPKAIDSMASSLVGLSEELVDAFADKGECDFMSAYGRPFPVIVFMQMMGLPMEQREYFIHLEHQLTQGKTPEARNEAAAAIGMTLYTLIEQRRADPRNDIVSKLVASQVDGAPITPEKLMGMCFTLFLAGLDTVAGALGHTMRYLAEHPELQAALRADPALIPDAIEESLRYHTWLPTGRLCVEDVEIAGRAIKKGDWVQILLWGASNDPQEMERAEEFLVSREPNRHFAFGSGVHRCAGSHLARRELRVALRTLLARLGEFRIKPGSELRYDGGMVCLSSLPLEWRPLDR